MNPPVTLDWADDDPALCLAKAEIDPVTAWSVWYGAASDAAGRTDEMLFYTLVDTDNLTRNLSDAAPSGDAAPDEEATIDTLQPVFQADWPLGAKAVGALAGRARPAADAAPQGASIAAPLIHLLPLRRASFDPRRLPGIDPETGMSKQPLVGFSPLAGPRAQAGHVPLNTRLPLSPDIPRGPAPQVIVGIIDYGINLLHDRFRHIDDGGTHRSRIAHAWVQDGAFGDDALVPFGREIHADEIERARADAHGDEEAALRTLGLLGFDGQTSTVLARRRSHGTHVLDLAAGMDPRDPRGMAVQIVAVALPEAVKRDSTGSVLGLFFMRGLAYILLRSRDILDAARANRGAADPPPPIPVLINASLGFSGGPRGGGHFIERAIDALLHHHETETGGLAPAQLALPAGNGNLARGHAAAIADPSADGVRLDLPWRLHPGDQSPNHLEAWIATDDAGQPPAIELRLTPPGTLGPPPEVTLTPGMSRRLVLAPAKPDGTPGTIGRIALSGPAAGRMRLSIALAPTDPGSSDRPAAAPGVWGLNIAASPPARAIHAWILRDDDPAGRSATARQSHFDDADYVERNARGALLADDPQGATARVRRAGTLNCIATCANRLVVAGHVLSADGTAPKPADYSGTPLPRGDPLSPAEAVSWSAPCDSSPVLPGVLAAGSLSGSLVAQNGTSVAVPQLVAATVARLLAGDAWPASPYPAAAASPAARLGGGPIRSPIALSRADARAGPTRPAPRL